MFLKSVEFFSCLFFYIPVCTASKTPDLKSPSLPLFTFALHTKWNYIVQKEHISSLISKFSVCVMYVNAVMRRNVVEAEQNSTFRQCIIKVNVGLIKRRFLCGFLIVDFFRSEMLVSTFLCLHSFAWQLLSALLVI